MFLTFHESLVGGGSRGSESRHPAQFYPSIPNPAKISSSTFMASVTRKNRERKQPIPHPAPVLS